MSGEVAYLDASAIVKLAVAEDETPALLSEVGQWPVRASSALARCEAVRAAVRADVPTAAVNRVLDDLLLIPVDDEVLAGAGRLAPPMLRSLDAIHLASAQRLGADLGTLITYDRRMADAGAACGLDVRAPA